MIHTSAKGEEVDFHIDLDAILQMEAEDPKFSLMALAESISDNVRLTDLAKLCRIVGWDMKDFFAHGFNVQDLMTILVECMGELGFTSAQDTPSS